MSSFEEEEKVDEDLLSVGGCSDIEESNKNEGKTLQQESTFHHSHRSNGSSENHCHKLGFSIATIMGFMGKKSDEEEKIGDKEAEIAADDETIEVVSDSTTIKDEKPSNLLPPPPKLWRPQPFRDLGAGGAAQSHHARYYFSTNS